MENETKTQACRVEVGSNHHAWQIAIQQILMPLKYLIPFRNTNISQKVILYCFLKQAPVFLLDLFRFLSCRELWAKPVTSGKTVRSPQDWRLPCLSPESGKQLQPPMA